MRHNPYTVLFGKPPIENIHRVAEERTILENFLSDQPTQQIYMISGVRGSGKTVFMTDIADRIREEKDWIVVELSSEGNILEKLGSALTADASLAKIFQNASINLSFFGFGLEVKGAPPITNIEVALTKMLESLKKKKKHVLVTIDEIVATPDMRAFASSFQLYVRRDFPIYLLMTGLYENIEELQNEKNLTFLYRAPKILLPPLNIHAVTENYRNAFKLNREEALTMARITRGYPYAFQALGYLVWENKKRLDPDVLIQLREYLETYVYEIIWTRLSDKDRQTAYAIAKSETGRTSDVLSFAGIDNNHFNPYRKRLIKKSIINGEKRGVVTFTLPLFEQFVIDMCEDIDYV